MRKVKAKVLLELEAIVPVGGIEQVERHFKQWIRNTNMHGISAEILLQPEFKDVQDAEV